MKDYSHTLIDIWLQLCIHMLFLLCENNVQACAFHLECNATWDLTVDVLLFMFNFFHMHPHGILAVWN